MDRLSPEIDHRTIEGLVASHENWRRECINLIASENVLSPAVRRYLSSDLVQRYGDYTGRDLAARRYQGNRYIVELERTVNQLACEVFGAAHVELRSLSGHIAGTAVLMGLTEPGDTILELGRDGGSHRQAGRVATPSLIDLKTHFLPFDPYRYNLDLDRAIAMIDELRPRMVILGSSNFLFPHPVREISAALKRHPGAILVYDASHVMGFLAAGRFQNPLAEGAQIVFGSTHKTLPGPQGGIIFSNDRELMERVTEAVSPSLVTNHHLFRFPALGLCLLEMQRWGAQYADQISANSQALGKALEARDIEMVSYDGCYSRSHTILARTARYGKGKDAAERLERANIILTYATLPEALGTEGLRIGTQEITRLGATEKDMEPLAQLIADVVTGRRSPEAVLPEAKAFAARFQQCRFTWDQS